MRDVAYFSWRAAARGAISGMIGPIVPGTGRNMDKRKLGNSGLEIEPLTCPSFDVLVLVQDERARSDEAHLSHEDVEKLGQLVQTEAS